MIKIQNMSWWYDNKSSKRTEMNETTKIKLRSDYSCSLLSSINARLNPNVLL
jgi:hypothetical protein